MTKLDIIEQAQMAEATVIGSCILGGNGTFEKALSVGLNAEHFSTDAWRECFLTMHHLWQVGTPIEPISVIQRLRERDVQSVSVKQLQELMDITVTTAQVEAYAAQVVDLGLRRQAAELAEKLLEDTASSAQEMIREMAEFTETAGRTVGAAGKKIVSAGEICKRITADVFEGSNGRKFALPTGYPCLDKALNGGLVPGCVYVIVARTGEGKSIFTSSIADNVARTEPVLYITLEMTPEQILAKSISKRSKSIQTRAIINPENFPADKLDDFRAAVEAAESLKLYVNGEMGTTVSDIAMAAKSIPGLKAIFIDHIGLLRPEEGAASGNRTQEISRITGELKQLAIRLKVPIVEVCQMSKTGTNASVEKAGNTAMLNALKDSSSISHDADYVLFLHREDYDDHTRKEWEPSYMELTVAKGRYSGSAPIQYTMYLLADRVEERGRKY